MENERKYSRRDIIKALATLPVFGLFAFEFLKKVAYDRWKKKAVLSELDLKRPAPAVVTRTSPEHSGPQVRLGIIGFGRRGEQIAQSLGFAHPDWIAKRKRNNRLEPWLAQKDLNVAITGIFDVFDVRAGYAQTVIKNKINPGDGSPVEKVKRYRSYRDMVTSDDIDAIIITTPDFHHATMAIAAVNEGKHVYCEKCMTRTEEEVYRVEAAVKAAEKSKGVVFQVGHQTTQNEVFQRAKEICDKEILGKITLVETSSSRNTPDGAWVRHLDENGNLRPGDARSIDWKEWLGSAPRVPFSQERFYNWSKYWDYATGLSGQLFSHEYDAANQLLGLGIPLSCVASGGIYYYKDGREIPDVFHATFEFPDRELTLFYSASLASSRPRRRVLMGHDAWMELGEYLNVFADTHSTRYRAKIRDGIVVPSRPMVSYQPGSQGIDAITSASEQYYAARGLIYTYRDGQRVNVTHLHLQEWLDAIRGGTPLSSPIEAGVEVSIACHMATKSYRESRRVEWDPVRRRIV
ncbi:MAG: Gfo/Idh/MocA family oxidoreductase [Fidelibacterota bacterium]|nr:MAG: Gfo/Idh/MocA family oxidoreductase [Candidatus Neomarinimicrobiota bacterium]